MAHRSSPGNSFSARLPDQSRTSGIRVALLGFTDLRTGAGTETVLLNYARFAPREGFSTTVVDTDHVFDDVAFLTDADVSAHLGAVTHVRIPDFYHKLRFLERHPTLGKVQALLVHPIYFRLVGRILQRRVFDWLNTFDVVVLMCNPLASCFPRRRGRQGARLVATNQCWSPNRLNVSALRIIPFSWMRRVDAVQLFTPEHPGAGLSTHRLRTFVVPNGVDTALYLPRSEGSSGQKVRLLFAGRLVDRKGVTVVVEAWRKMTRQREVELHVAGDGPLRNDLRRVREEGFTFHGGLRDRELAALYRASDVFVYPSTGDTFALVVLQALSSGLYCLVGRELTGIYDRFVEQAFAEYIDPADVATLASRLDQIVSNRGLLLSRSRECHDLVVSRFDWSIVTKQLYENLSGLVDS